MLSSLLPLNNAARIRRTRGLAAVSTALIKELRSRSGAPIAAVKSALEEESGDIDAAFDRLRRMGAKIASVRAGRAASEGLVGVLAADDGRLAALLELNCETDFVSRTDGFRNLVAKLTTSALDSSFAAVGDGAVQIQSEELAQSAGNDALLAEAANMFGENVRLGRVVILRGEAIGSYVHGVSRAAGTLDTDDRVQAGRIGVAVALNSKNGIQSGGDSLINSEIWTVHPAKQLAMHIAADAPLYVRRNAVPPEVLAKELQIMTDAARSESSADVKQRGDVILKKIAEGRLNKWLSTVVLEEQIMLTSDERNISNKGKPLTVQAWLEQACSGYEIGPFVRIDIGSQ